MMWIYVDLLSNVMKCIHDSIVLRAPDEGDMVGSRCPRRLISPLRILWPTLGEARVWGFVKYLHTTTRSRPKSLAFVHDGPKPDDRDAESSIELLILTISGDAVSIRLQDKFA